jgi:hypothetical protein
VNELKVNYLQQQDLAGGIEGDRREDQKKAIIAKDRLIQQINQKIGEMSPQGSTKMFK